MKLGIIYISSVFIFFSCAKGRGASDLCGNDQCDPNEDSFSCPKDCGPESCGNGDIDNGEECDGDNLNGQSCSSLGYGGGDLSCFASCLYDYSGCDSNCSDACIIDEYQCSDNRVEKCIKNSDGCTVWTVTENCNDFGKTCENNAGVVQCSDSCMDLCSEGTSQCDNGVVQECVLSGGCYIWSDSTNCINLGQICQFDGNNASCVDNCSDTCTQSGDIQCFGNTIQTCIFGVNGCLEWDNSQDCSSMGKICSEGSCSCPVVCSSGEHQCNGNVVQHCNTSSFGCFEWSDIEDCDSSGENCVFDGTTASCQPDCTDSCSLGEVQCNGDSVETCGTGTSGCLEMNYTEDCTASNKICISGSCECPVTCNSGETQCNGNVVESCDIQTNGCYDWVTVEDCSLSGNTCNLGSCSIVFHGYNKTTFNSGYTSIANNGTSSDLGGPYDDATGSFSIPLFNFFGTDYTSIWISSNGWLAFDASDPTSVPDNHSLPDSGAPHAAVYPFWDDHVIDTWYWSGAGLWMDISGTAPNRVITVEWKNTIHYDSTDWNDHRASFQVKLYETTGIIELLYDRSAWMGTFDWSGTVGIEDDTIPQSLSEGSSLSDAPSNDIRYTPY